MVRGGYSGVVMGVKTSLSTATMAMKLKVMAAAPPARSNSGITVVMTAEGA